MLLFYLFFAYSALASPFHFCSDDSIDSSLSLSAVHPPACIAKPTKAVRRPIDRMRRRHSFLSYFGITPLRSPEFHSKYTFTRRLLGAGSNGNSNHDVNYQGMVYEAIDKHTKARVAVKIGTNPSYVDGPCELLQEVAVLIKATMVGINIVKYVGCGWESKRVFFIITEAVGDGEDSNLGGYVKRQKFGVLTLKEAVGYVAQLAKVLTELHSIGIYHGDVKLTNILIDDARTVRLIDFGGGDQLTPTRRYVQIFKGTWVFASPEAKLTHTLLRRVYDAFKNDVYSLGVTLFCMIVGETLNDPRTNLKFDKETGVFAGMDAELVQLFRGMLDPSEKSRWTMSNVYHHATRINVRMQIVD